MCTVVKRNNRSTTKGEKIITLFTINYGIIQVLNRIVAKVEHQNCLLKKLSVNVETKSFKNMTNSHSQTPSNLDMFPMVKKRFQDCRCRDANNC
jgi:hypothetical protein